MGTIYEIDSTEVGNNVELKEFLDRTIKLNHDLYIDMHFAADQLQAVLTTVKGIKNYARARLISAQMRVAAECHKSAAYALKKTWGKFQQQFAAELAAAPSNKKKVPEKFKIV